MALFNSIKPLLLSVGVGAAFASTAAVAANESGIKASIGVQLIDLDTSDNITPTITYTDILSRSWTSAAAGPNDVPHDIDNERTDFAPNSSGFNLGNGAVNVSSSWTGGTFGSINISGHVNGQGFYSGNENVDAKFILSPHTSIILTGLASGYIGDSGPNQSSSSIINAALRDINDPNSQGFTGFGLFSEFSSIHQYNDREFSLRLDNPGDVAMQGQLYLYGSAGAVTAAVPEPETYAMMLGGLALIGALARRRAGKQA